MQFTGRSCPINFYCVRCVLCKRDDEHVKRRKQRLEDMVNQAKKNWGDFEGDKKKEEEEEEEVKDQEKKEAAETAKKPEGKKTKWKLKDVRKRLRSYEVRQTEIYVNDYLYGIKLEMFLVMRLFSIDFY